MAIMTNQDPDDTAVMEAAAKILGLNQKSATTLLGEMMAREAVRRQQQQERAAERQVPAGSFVKPELVMDREIEDAFISSGVLRVVIKSRYSGDRRRALEYELRAQCLRLGLPAFAIALGEGAYTESAFGVVPFTESEVAATRFLSDMIRSGAMVDPHCDRMQRGNYKLDRVSRAQVRLQLSKDGVIGIHTSRVVRAVLAVIE